MNTRIRTNPAPKITNECAPLRRLELRKEEEPLCDAVMRFADRRSERNSSRNFRNLVGFIAMIFLIASVSVSQAHHIREGVMWWTKISADNDSFTVRFTLRVVFTKSRFDLNHSCCPGSSHGTIANGNIIDW